MLHPSCFSLHRFKKKNSISSAQVKVMYFLSNCLSFEFHCPSCPLLVRSSTLLFSRVIQSWKPAHRKVVEAEEWKYALRIFEICSLVGAKSKATPISKRYCKSFTWLAQHLFSENDESWWSSYLHLDLIWPSFSEHLGHEGNVIEKILQHCLP